MLKLISKNKKILVIVGLILTLPFTLSIITIVLEVILNIGRYIGSFAQMIGQNIC